jgi:LmbE family N-acetylglucosaminyl deacetylase
VNDGEVNHLLTSQILDNFSVGNRTNFGGWAAARASIDHSDQTRAQVVCVGGHPDDPESGCAGTLALYQELGSRPAIVYLTRGERGIQSKSNDEAARIRSAECEAACKALGAAARFAGQIDGSADFTRTRVQELQEILADERPDVVFTHWPVDTHMDHQVASMCTIRACLALKPHPELYFFEETPAVRHWDSPPTTTWTSPKPSKKRKPPCSLTRARTEKASGKTTTNQLRCGEAERRVARQPRLLLD